jgi:hypothetical protein
VADWDNTEGSERDEDAAWRDLVAQFDIPLAAQQPVPWPDREDMPPQTREPRGTHEAEGVKGAYEADAVDGTGAVSGTGAADGADGAYGELGTDGTYLGSGGIGADGAWDAFGAGRLSGAAHDPDLTLVPRLIRGPAAGGTPARGTPTEDDEHFVPPAPPPLPRLDPLTKGAWAALFGGPGYLVVAAAAGWSVPGLAAFCAVAAFVAGFAILVLRMNDPGAGDPDDGDDGAVV